jgi:protein gp37
MSIQSSIEWTDATWNPVRGCTKVSPGCKNCYAEVFAERFRGVPGHAYERGFDLRLVPEKLAEPLRWGTPRMIFVNSMSDLFHDQVPGEYIQRVAEVMSTANWHTFQVLTKRSSRMSEMLRTSLKRYAGLKHIWWGVSVEDRKYGLPRIDDLRKAPGAVRFLSVEPLLENIGKIDLGGISWVIVGGESGARARPIESGWVVSIRNQCKAARVPFFFKQWGGRNKKKSGRVLEGNTYSEFPPDARRPVPSRSVRDNHIADLTGQPQLVVL